MSLVRWSLACTAILCLVHWTKGEDYVPRTGEGRSFLPSCRGHCGWEYKPPCSCEIHCVVLRNCCDNFHLDCPEMFSEARQLFKHLLGLTLQCTEPGILTLASCGNETFSSANGSKDFGDVKLPDFNNDISNVSPNERTVENQGDLTRQSSFIFQFLKNAPIYDSYTGFMYTNFSTYTCNADVESIPVYWQASVNVSTLEGNPGTDHLKKLLTESDITYIPPVQVENNCAPKYFDLCENMPALMAEEPDKVCRNSILRKARLNRTACCFCFGRNKCQFHVDQRTFTEPLSVIFKLQGNKIEITLDSKAVKGLRTALPWKSVSCNLLEQQDLTNVADCLTHECSPGLVKNHGTCTQIYALDLAFADDGYPLTSLEKQHLSDFVACHFEKDMGIHLVAPTKMATLLANTPLNMDLYRVEITVYLPGHVPDVGLETQNNILWNITAMFKAFLNYRRIAPRSNVSEPVRESELPQSFARIWVMRKRSILFERENMTQNETTSICLSNITDYSIHYTADEYDLTCWQDKTYEHEEEEITRLTNSECYSIFKLAPGKKKNLALSLHVHYSYITIILPVRALIFLLV